jgi:single-strand DNA-binding protein
MTVNKVTLIGNLGRDAEIRITVNGATIANLRLATTDRRKAQDGTWEDHTEWHSVVAFGKTAEIMEKWGKKGKMLYIDGRLQTREYTDKDGNKRWSTEVVANEIRMLGAKGEGESQPTGYVRQSHDATSGRASAGGNASRGSTGRQEPQGGGYPDDDGIPF